MDARTLHSEYQMNYQLFKELAEAAKSLLSHEVSKANIKIHSMPVRVKSLNSFIEKIQKEHYQHPFTDVKDLVGIRVVCLFSSDIEKIATVSKNSFEILEEDNKIQNNAPNSFEHMDHKFIAKLKEESFLPSSQKFPDRPFEIQIRTIAQDAWASISHIFYKKEWQIPQRFERDFYALHGLFYVADTHFDMLKDFPVKETVEEHENG
jgi:putative GTP pyrophosphokinase